MPAPDILASPAFYEIVVAGQISANWAAWFDGLVLEPLPGGLVRLSGTLPDQPALHGVLERIRDLNLVLISVQRAAC